MSASFLAIAAARSADCDGATVAPGLIYLPSFWTVETGAPLLRRNAGFLTHGGPPDAWRERLSEWPALVGVEGKADVAEGLCDDEAALRIFLRDAERTFQHPPHRERMIGLLKRVWPENRDYHQGLGYVCSLFMLFFDDDTVCAMLLRISRDERYTPGYWRAAPEPYVRDAMVFSRLVEERFPQVASLLQAACVVPEAYASKWFIGLCVHVLPFQVGRPASSPPSAHHHERCRVSWQALLPFVEGFLRDGYVFLFRFSMALVEAISPRYTRVDSIPPLSASQHPT